MSPRRLACGLALAALLAAPAATTFAVAAVAMVDASEREAWQQRVADARAEVDRANRRRDAAQAAVDRMRHRRRPRGDAREALFQELDAARMDAVRTERALEELLDEARRGGVPPGWLRAPAAQPPAASP